jgi:predicted ribosome quality control (RQC) complex YloA/Tae2 family protein
LLGEGRRLYDARVAAKKLGKGATVAAVLVQRRKTKRLERRRDRSRRKLDAAIARNEHAIKELEKASAALKKAAEALKG